MTHPLAEENEEKFEKPTTTSPEEEEIQWHIPPRRKKGAWPVGANIVGVSIRKVSEDGWKHETIKTLSQIKPREYVRLRDSGELVFLLPSLGWYKAHTFISMRAKNRAGNWQKFHLFGFAEEFDVVTTNSRSIIKLREKKIMTESEWQERKKREALIALLPR